MAEKIIKIEVENSIEKDIRVDYYLSSQLKEYSRTRIQRWIKSGNILINNEIIHPSRSIKEGDKILIKIPEPTPTGIIPEKMDLDIIYEDEDILVINKPAGVVVHPGAGNHSGTLLNGVVHYLKEIVSVGDRERPGVVHRLDKDTSGLIIFAKNDIAHQKLTENIKKRKVKRIYHAIVQGVIPHKYGICNAPIGRDPKNRKKMAVTDKNSKPAITHFKRLEVFKEFTYLEIKLETGRTHQIRVHMNYIGFPVAGDTVYGRKKKTHINRPALHAYKLRFNHPATNKLLELIAPLPDDFNKFLEHLRKGII